MSAIAPLAALAALLAGFAATHSMLRRRRQDRLRAIAAAADFHYSPIDRFDLSARIRLLGPAYERLPVLRVRDVMYRSRGTRRSFVFTLELEPMHREPLAPRLLCVVERGDVLKLEQEILASPSTIDAVYPAALQGEAGSLINPGQSEPVPPGS